MRKKIKQKILVYYLIPMILILIWLGLSLFTLLSYSTSFSVLTYSHKGDSVISPMRAILYARTVLSGEITAKENYLGAIAIRLHNFNGGGVEEDRIIFQMKEKGAANWYYQHEYTGGQFHELDLFPFGFPVIHDSKGKTYVFRIRSLYGNSLTALELTDQYPIVVSQYQFSKGYLLSNRENLTQYIVKKTLYQFENFDVKLLIAIYIMPLLLYLIGLSPLGNFIYRPVLYFVNIFDSYVKKKTKLGRFVISFARQISIYEIVLFLIVIADVLFINNGATGFVASVLLLSLLVSNKIFKSKNKNEFIAAIILMAICSSMYVTGYKLAAERAATWIYIFILIGVFNALRSNSI